MKKIFYAKKDNGITLIALVVTIIVLLILAGISLLMLTGQNGVLTRAAEAREKTEEAREREIIQMALQDICMDNYGVLKFDEEILKQALENNSGIDGIEVQKITIANNKPEYIVTFPESQRNYKIYEDGNFAQTKKVKDDTIDSIKQKDENTYIIQSIEDLVILSNNVKSGTNYAGITFQLEQDLDFKDTYSYIDCTSTKYGDINGDGITEELITELITGNGFYPIGDYRNAFYGNFDGCNYTIKNLYIQRTGQSIGFIGQGENNTIKNLNVIDSTIIGNYPKGIIVGRVNKGIIIMDNCYTSGEISGKEPSGAGIGEAGAYGDASVKITNFKNDANIKDASNYYAGGVIGRGYHISDMELENCTNTGTVVAQAGNGGGILGGTGQVNGNLRIKNCQNYAQITAGKAGGIVGDCAEAGKVTIENSINTGKIEGHYYVGGIAGEFYHIPEIYVSNSYNTGEIVANSYVGGITGRVEKKTVITSCYNTGEITARCEVGGIVGVFEGTAVEGSKIEKSYNTGDINSSEDYSSGIIGYGNSSSQLSIQYCYNEGNVTGMNYSGGICADVCAKISNCYNRGNISVEGGYAGGISSRSSDSNEKCIIENTYNTGIITTTYTGTKKVGGIVGIGDEVTNSYNFGTISIVTGDGYIGAIVGFLTSTESVLNCYYLKDTWNIGIGNTTDTTTPNESESELKNLLNQNFSEIEGWKLDENEGFPIFDF